MELSAHQPRKRFGQHFLRDPRIIERIIAVLNAKPGQHWVEIGPGLGALTTELLPLIKEIEVVELDRDIIPRLEEACRDLGMLTIYSADALQFDFRQLVKNEQRLRIVGNLPYNISTPLLFHLLEQQSAIQDMYFMLQKEVVQRICAPAGGEHYGRLSVMVQYYCDVAALFTVHAHAFSPPPKVESAFIRIEPRPPLMVAQNLDVFAKIVQQAFSQRRKMLHNSVHGLLSNEQILSVGIDPNIRPEQLTVTDFVKMSNIVP